MCTATTAEPLFHSFGHLYRKQFKIKNLGFKSGNYHNDTSHIDFIKCVEAKVIPNSVLVVDNAFYQNVTVGKYINISFSSLKIDMFN